MPSHTASLPMKTHMVRVPVTGPEPMNTLIYLHGRAIGIDDGALFGVADAQQVTFSSECHIEGYEKHLSQWYTEHTRITSAVMLRFLNTETDLTFTMAVDDIRSFIDSNGFIAFTVAYSQYYSDEAILPPARMMTQVGAAVTAFVLCYEPSPLDVVRKRFTAATAADKYFRKIHSADPEAHGVPNRTGDHHAQ